MSKKTQIRYAFKHEKDEETGIIEPLFTTKYVESDNCKRYFNTIYKTANLTPGARNLLDYLVERMNKENEVGNTQLLKMEYIAFMQATCGITYTDNTVNKGFQELKKAELLVQFSRRRAVYIVNPMHFFRGSEAKRSKLLQKMLNATPEGKYVGTNLVSALGLAA